MILFRGNGNNAGGKKLRDAAEAGNVGGIKILYLTENRLSDF